MSRRRHALVPATLVAVVALGATACAEDGGGPERVTVGAGQVEAVPATAIDLDTQAVVALPTGVLSLELSSDVGPTSSGDTDVAADDGTTLVGVGWTFEAQPSSDARDAMLDGGEVSALPQPTVTLVDGADAIEVPVTAKAGGSGAVVVGTRDATALEVDYDGSTQTVDLATGSVDAGPAEPLVDLAGTATEVGAACPAGDFPRAATLDHGCEVENIYRLPYISGLGWAEDTGSWLVVDARVRGEATMRLGDDEGTPLESGAASVQRTAFAAGDTAPQRIDFDFGAGIGVVSVPLPG